MPKVSIIGTGDVGATVAYTLQLAGLATELVLVDANAALAAGHALDLNHGLLYCPPVELRAGGLDDCAGSQVIVLTAGARQQPGESRLDLTRRNAAIVGGLVADLRPYLGEAVLLVLTNPVDVMTRVAQRAAGLPPRRVIGSGTVLDSARFRYELARWCEVDARNVHAYVLGEHGDSEVFCWSHATIGALPLADFCGDCRRQCGDGMRAGIETRVRESAYHLIEAKGHTNYGIAQATSRIVAAIVRGERSLLTVSTLLRGEYGLDGVCLSVPCLVGDGGVLRIVEAKLTKAELRGLHHCAEVVRAQ